MTRRCESGPVLYNGSAGFKPAVPANSSEGACPGIEAGAAAQVGVSCSHRFATQPSAHFEEVVELKFTEEADVHLVLEMAENHGVGSWGAGAQFAVAGDAAEEAGEWHYQSGLREESMVAIWSSLVQAFAMQK
jgi:hypothetical protein